MSSTRDEIILQLLPFYSCSKRCHLYLYHSFKISSDDYIFGDNKKDIKVLFIIELLINIRNVRSRKIKVTVVYGCWQLAPKFNFPLCFRLLFVDGANILNHTLERILRSYGENNCLGREICGES